MANRDAIRDLQARLATRLQSVQSQGVAVAWLAVRAGSAHYLLPLAQAGEIYPLAQAQKVPYAQAWFLGVLNIRGGLFGVVDLAAFIASSQGQPVPSGAAPEGRSVVTFNPALDMNCALVVDDLLGLRGAEDFVASSARDAQAPAYFGNCFTDGQQQVWQEIDLRALSMFSSFLNIGA